MKIGARSSPLSRAQVEEVSRELLRHHPQLILEPVWAESPGDRDKTTSLREVEKSDFFTRDLDEMLLNHTIQIACHSAKDLPDPLCARIKIVALTRGIASQDALVLRPGATLETLQKGAVIATSSRRREEVVKKLRSDLTLIDLRGHIEERLSKLDKGEADGVVVAEAALIRLRLTHLNRIILAGETTPLQGRIAILARSNDLEAIHFMRCLNCN
jgi:hydroxymethylbilane synthase